MDERKVKPRRPNKDKQSDRKSGPIGNAPKKEHLPIIGGKQPLTSSGSLPNVRKERRSPFRSSSPSDSRRQRSPQKPHRTSKPSSIGADSHDQSSPAGSSYKILSPSTSATSSAKAPRSLSLASRPSRRSSEISNVQREGSSLSDDNRRPSISQEPPFPAWATQLTSAVQDLSQEIQHLRQKSQSQSVLLLSGRHQHSNSSSRKTGSLFWNQATIEATLPIY